MSLGEYSCELDAVGQFEARRGDMPAVRLAVATQLTNRGLSANLKHADDQSVVAIAGVLEAIGHSQVDKFRSWGVVAAPRTPGRAMTRQTLTRFRTDGAWGVSPQIIPQLSLHSIAGLVSVTFRMSGPNVGAGGVVNTEGEAFTVASTMLDAACPGVWVVLSGWDSPDEAVCRSVAMGLTPATLSGDRLTITRGSSSRSEFSLEGLASSLSTSYADGHWALHDGWIIRLTRRANRRIAA